MLNHLEYIYILKIDYDNVFIIISILSLVFKPLKPKHQNIIINITNHQKNERHLPVLIKLM